MAFETLSERLQSALKSVTRKGKLTEKDVDVMMREVRLALLEADVNIKVVREFIKEVKEKAIGETVLKSLTPGQQVIKIVNEELTKLMGENAAELNFGHTKPAVFMMVGLQGAGKTTHTGKLSTYLRKKEKKNPPLLYNLAELQNDCSRMFKLSPDETLKVVQELYEKKLVTYPRTDARVLSTAVAKEIYKNISGLRSFAPVSDYAQEVIEMGSYKAIAKTRYVNDKQITDHYAIIPTGQGMGALKALNRTAFSVYTVIAKRFLSIFYPAAEYQKMSLVLNKDNERFFANFKVLLTEGYLKVAGKPTEKQKEGEESEKFDEGFIEVLKNLKKGSALPICDLFIKEGETTPPKRYNSGSMILAMENAGQLIEDEELRATIKGSGIGTSATRAEILKKLVTIKYLALNKKTQIITPTQLGEMVFDVVDNSLRSLLNPELTASWEKGLNYVAEGSITPEEYMQKLDHFVSIRTHGVKQLNNQWMLRDKYEEVARNYQ